MIAFCKFAYECKIHRKENIKDYHRTSFTFIFPEYKKLIYIGLTFPLSTKLCEKSFSTQNKKKKINKIITM